VDFPGVRATSSLVEIFDERTGVALMKTLGGVATNGDKGDDMPPMNSGGRLSLMNPKAYIGLDRSM